MITVEKANQGPIEVNFKRISNGVFESYVNGVKSRYGIINGCLGSSGRGGNLYGITNTLTGKTNWLGSLQKCKKSISFQLRSEGGV